MAACVRAASLRVDSLQLLAQVPALPAWAAMRKPIAGSRPNSLRWNQKLVAAANSTGRVYDLVRQLVGPPRALRVGCALCTVRAHRPCAPCIVPLRTANPGPTPNAPWQVFWGDSMVALLILNSNYASIYANAWGPLLGEWRAVAPLGVAGSTVEELTYRMMAGGERFEVDPLVGCPMAMHGTC